MTPPTFPILHTDRLVLRQLSLTDCDAIYELRSSLIINTYLNRKECRDLDEAKDFINTITKSTTEGQSFYWAISFLATDELLGTICLFDINTLENCGELGFELREKFQNQGIMTEVVKTIIHFAFNFLNLKTIKAYTHPDNLASINLLNKLNFILVDKKSIDLNYYTLEK